MYSVKRFSNSLTKETKTQKKARKDLTTASVYGTGLAGLLGVTEIDSKITNKSKDRLGNIVNKGLKKDLDNYNKTASKISSRANELRKGASRLEQAGIDHAENLLHLKNKSNYLNKTSKSYKAGIRGLDKINKASNKRLAIGAGITAATAAGVGYGVNKALKKRNQEINEAKKKKFSCLIDVREFSGKFASKAADAIEDVVEISENKFASPNKINKIKAQKTKAIKWIRKNPKSTAGIAAGVATLGLGTGAALYTLDKKRKKENK